jgi:hypothetical protein
MALASLRPQDLALLRDLIDYQDRAELASIHDAEFLVVFILNDGDLTHPAIAGSRRVSMRSLKRLDRIGALDVQSETDAAIAFWLADRARELLAPTNSEAEPRAVSGEGEPAEPSPSRSAEERREVAEDVPFLARDPPALTTYDVGPDIGPHSLPAAAAAGDLFHSERQRPRRIRAVAILALLVLMNIAAIVAIGVVRAHTAVHLEIESLTNATSIAAGSDSNMAGFALTSSVKNLDLFRGPSDATLDLDLDATTCAGLVVNFDGTCTSGLVARGPVELVYSTGTSIIATSEAAKDVLVLAQPSRSDGFLSLCADRPAGSGVAVRVTPLSSGTLSIGDGTTTFAVMNAGARLQHVHVSIPAFESPCDPQHTASLFVEGLGYPAAVLIEGTSMEVSGMTGHVTAGGLDRAIVPRTTVFVGADSKEQLDLSFRPGDPPVRTMQDPLVASRLEIDGLNYTPSLAEADAWLSPTLEATLLALLAVFGVALLPLLADRRGSEG